MKLFLLITTIGIALLAFCGYSYTQEQKFLNRAERTIGTVADYRVQRENDSDTYCPVITFDSRDGQTVIFYATVCTSPASYQIGEQVEVLYDPFDLDWVQLDTFWSKYTGIIILFFIGLSVFLLGLWGMSASRAKRNKQ